MTAACATSSASAALPSMRSAMRQVRDAGRGRDALGEDRQRGRADQKQHEQHREDLREPAPAR